MFRSGWEMRTEEVTWRRLTLGRGAENERRNRENLRSTREIWSMLTSRVGEMLYGKNE